MAVLAAIQRGSKTLASASASMTVVRGTDTGFDTTVTPGSTILLLTFRTAASTNGPAMIRWVLTDGDTITVTRAGSTTGDVVCYWTLLSFTSGVLVQHETVALTGVSTNTGAIDAASLGGGRWIIANGCETGETALVRIDGQWKFDSTTQISVTRGSATGNITYSCQVVEYVGATVQEKLISKGASTDLTHDEAITSVDASLTALFGSTRHGSDNWDAVRWSASLTSATNLRLARTTGTSLAFEFTVYVVTFSDGTVVRRNAVAHADTVTSVDTTITAVTLAQSVALMCGVAVLGASMGRSGSAGGRPDRHCVSSELTATTTHQSVRADGGAAQDYESQVIQFNNAAASGAPRHLLKGYDQGFNAL